MSVRASAATAARVLSQLRHDLRTVALLLVVPCVLLTLLKYLFEDQPQTFDRIGVPLVGLFPLLQMFIVTSVTMLRERTSGTLERLMASPLAKLDLLAGYAAAFALVGIAQATLVATYALAALGLDTSANGVAVVALAAANALLGMSLGLLASAFARTASRTSLRWRKSSAPAERSTSPSSPASPSSRSCSAPQRYGDVPPDRGTDLARAGRHRRRGSALQAGRRTARCAEPR